LALTPYGQYTAPKRAKKQDVFRGIEGFSSPTMGIAIYKWSRKPIRLYGPRTKKLIGLKRMSPTIPRSKSAVRLYIPSVFGFAQTKRGGKF
jgi:hypothetical protein